MTDLCLQLTRKRSWDHLMVRRRSFSSTHFSLSSATDSWPAVSVCWSSWYVSTDHVIHSVCYWLNLVR
jgi:hypothetical protein